MRVKCPTCRPVKVPWSMTRSRPVARPEGGWTTGKPSRAYHSFKKTKWEDKVVAADRPERGS